MLHSVIQAQEVVTRFSNLDDAEGVPCLQASLPDQMVEGDHYLVPNYVDPSNWMVGAAADDLRGLVKMIYGGAGDCDQNSCSSQRLTAIFPKPL